MIPKIIHYCWFGGKPLPKTARKCLASWKKMCPDYEIKRWDESNFDVRQNSFISSAYEAGAWAFVSDWARLKIIYDHGGIYLDTDIELLKPLDGLLDNLCYMGVQQPALLCTTGLGFGAVKASPVVHEMLMQYEGLQFSWDKSQSLACPFLNDRVVRSYGYEGDGSGEITQLPELTVYPCRFFDPISTGATPNLLCDESISVSLYAHSWGSRTSRIKRSIVNFLGPELTYMIKKLRR